MKDVDGRSANIGPSNVQDYRNRYSQEPKGKAPGTSSEFELMRRKSDYASRSSQLIHSMSTAFG